MKFNSQYSFLILLLIFVACNKQETNFNYDAISREVGPNGKTLNFYEDFSSDYKTHTESALATLEIPNGALDSTIIVDFKRFRLDNFEWTNLVRESINGFIYYSDAILFLPRNQSFNKSITLTFPFVKKPEIIDEELLSQTAYRFMHNRFKPYRIKYNNLKSLKNDIINFENWEEISDFNLDTINYRITTTINNFNYVYVLVFKEIVSNDLLKIQTTGDYNLVLKSEYFSSDHYGNSYFYYRDGVSYYSPFSITDQFNSMCILDFSFNGNTIGSYVGPTMCYFDFMKTELINSNWVTYHFYATSDTKIEITKYGNIGEQVQGEMSGTLKDNISGKEIIIDGFFDVTRVR